MVKANQHFQKLPQNYLFREIDKRVALFRDKNPSVTLHNLGIGDVTEPIAPSIIKAMLEATKEMGSSSSFKGYGPSNGYPFLREKIAEKEYQNRISPDEIFIYNGTKDAISSIQSLFALSSKVTLMDPTYPVYFDSNIIAGRKRFSYLPCLKKNGFFPRLPKYKTDLIYLCSPNNPIGVTMPKEELAKWVQLSLKDSSVILFDGAYQSFISSNAPKSIYEVEGAKKVAVEFRSFSKEAGFTNLRCSYLVIPDELIVDGCQLNKMWKRECDSTFGGVPYPIQKGAEAIYSPDGQKEVAAQIQSYKKRAALLASGLRELNFYTTDGQDSPFVWCKTPKGYASWQFFDLLLEKAHVIAVPGSGFGKCGEGFMRFSAFAQEESINQVLTNLRLSRSTYF